MDDTPVCVVVVCVCPDHMQNYMVVHILPPPPVCCVLAKGRNKKRRVRLSYAYGPDVELSNLRNNYRQNQAANNPHYMWCVCVHVCVCVCVCHGVPSLQVTGGL